MTTQINNDFLPAEIIKKKRNKESLSKIEIDWIIKEYTAGRLPDYQMSALLMAIFFNGMSESETLALTQAMLYSGKVMSYPNIPTLKVDKHSTGGVGDKTSLILGPIVAACGVVVPMISGRGLGHTGGTLDKLESIPGFNIQLDLNEFTNMLQNIGVSFIGQTSEICPADKKIYALRDVTATVESLPLICASIMSKKLAEGIDALVLDVKFGSGAFMKSFTDAEQLALALKKIGEGAGKKVIALLTNMNQPLGAFIGNALEVKECLDILENKTFLNDQGIDLYSDTRELSLELSAYMILLGEKANSLEEARRKASEALLSGRALAKFKELCKTQCGDINALSQSALKYEIKSHQNGYLSGYKTEQIGIAAIQIGAGRAKVTDIIDPTAGFQIHKKIGDKINLGDTLFTVHANSLEKIKNIEKFLYETIEWSENSTRPQDLIAKILR